MTNSIFNPELVDIYSQPMFLGKSVNVSRNDIFKHKIFDTIEKQQTSFFWKPEEFKLTEDRKQFKELSPNEQHIFISNLKYQTLLDSIQGRAPCQTFLEVSSLPEIERFIVTWSYFETIHAKSYTHIMQNVFANPSIILDDIPVNEEIIARAKPISRYYDELKILIHKYSLGQLDDIKILKKALFLTLVSVNVLEGIRFYVSFACSFAFMEGKKVMEGNSKIIQSIAFDEALHLSATQHMINLIQNNKDDDQEMHEIALSCKEEVVEIFRSAVEQEKAWARYLFKDGSILGLNEEILVEYLEFLCNQRMNAIGYDGLFKHKKNPISWINSWLSKNSRSSAPQEGEIVSYVSGKIDHDNGDIDDILL